jgi:hypothetical protein
MYEDFIKELKKNEETNELNVDDVKAIVEDIFLIFGAIIYFETLYHSKELNIREVLEREDGRAICRFKTHAFIQNFDIMVNLVSSEDKKTPEVLKV